jgi:hypothetical protein
MVKKSRGADQPGAFDARDIDPLFLPAREAVGTMSNKQRTRDARLASPLKPTYFLWDALKNITLQIDLTSDLGIFSQASAC